MKNILYALALIVSFSSFGQTLRSGDWEYYENFLDGWLIVNKSPKCVKSCDWLSYHKPSIALSNEENMGKGVMFEINGPFYSNYNGSDIKVELILKNEK